MYSEGGSATFAINRWTGVARLQQDMAGELRSGPLFSFFLTFTEWRVRYRKKEQEIRVLEERLVEAGRLLAESNQSQARLTHQQRQGQVRLLISLRDRD